MFTHVCDGLSWLGTNKLVTKFGPPKQKILAPPLDDKIEVQENWVITQGNS